MFGRKKKILIIEDNTYNHDLYRTAFEKAGFEVKIFNTADGLFLDAVASYAPDIISMDIMIGKKGGPADHDGFDALRMLKEDSRTLRIPVMMLSSFSDEDKIARAKEIGAVDFINVPGEAIQKIPSHFVKYLQNPRRYTPSHPLFREYT